jgi:hypothetical protein
MTSPQRSAQVAAITKEDGAATELREVLLKYPSTLSLEYIAMLGSESRNLPPERKEQIHQVIFEDIQRRDQANEAADVLFTLFKVVASQEAEVDVARLLITKYKSRLGPDGDFDFRGGTSLHHAVQFASSSVFTALLDRILDVSETEQYEIILRQDVSRTSVLQLAISKWNLEIVKILVERYPNILTKMFSLKLANQKPVDGQDANSLHVAINAAYETLGDKKPDLIQPDQEVTRIQCVIEYIVLHRRELLWKDECLFGPPYAFGRSLSPVTGSKFGNILRDLKNTIMTSLHSINEIRKALHKTGGKHPTAMMGPIADYPLLPSSNQ